MINRICEVCKKNVATEAHHLFSQGGKKGWRYKLYGELLHSPSNIIHICEKCHKWRPIPKDDERTFCDKLGITPRSKTSKIGGKNYDTN